MSGDQYGNGTIDGCVFQLDAYRDHYIDEKRRVVESFRAQHVCRGGPDEYEHAAGAVEGAACAFIRERLAAEYGGVFTEDVLAGKSFDELAMIVQEDLAIHCAPPVVGATHAGIKTGSTTGDDWLAAAHVCFPSGWNPAQKVGRSFAAIHAPVRVRARSFLMEDEDGGGETGGRRDYVGGMVRAERPHVRFIWSLQCGDRLNQNPAIPGQREPFAVNARGGPNTHLRVERQTITALIVPGDVCRAALFTIRVYLYPIPEVIADEERRAALREAIEQMPVWQRRYKNWDGQMVKDLERRLGKA